MELKAKTILIDDLKEGMLLHNDVITTAGILLKPKGTIVSNSDINFFKNRKIDIVTISEMIETVEIADKSFYSRQARKEQKQLQVEVLNKLHDKHTKDLQKKIMDIGKGKDVKVKELNQITKNLIKETKNSSVLFNYLAQMKQTDTFIETHSINVSTISNIIATWAGFDQETIENVTLAGLLHDIGFMDIDSSVYHKKGPLSDHDRKIVESHVWKGYEKLKDTNINPKVKQAILLHHERNDGSGYLKYDGDKIPIESKIVAIADTYEAMTSDRPYRRRMTPFKAIQAFETELKYNYDMVLTYIFLEHIGNQFIGSFAELSNGKEGVITWVNPRNITKPLIDVDGEIIDLEVEDISIIKVF